VIEEEKNEETEETPVEDAPVEETAAPDETPPAEEPAAEEAPAEAEEAPAEEAPAEEAPAEEAPAEEPAAEAPAPAEPEEVLHPKERRRRARSQHSGETRPERSPEERATERAEARRKKAAERRRWRQRSRERRRARPTRTEPISKGEHGPGAPRIRQGVVVSDGADKTITVRIDVTRRHRLYKKIVRESSTLHAHDERNEAHAGDTVRVVESRPLSRTKRWRLVEILERAR
jgi:small subunit ribosomal protein S17